MTSADSDLGPMPEPEIEPGEPSPGGVDAVDARTDRTIPDLSPGENPSIEEKAPDAIKEEVAEGEDTSTKATRADDGGDSGDEPAKESPA